MEEAETVSAETADNFVEEPSEATESTQEEQKEEQIPLRVLQKERKKRQEAEMRAQWVEERLNQLTKQIDKGQAQAQAEDETNYEAVTKGDLKQYSQTERQEIIRTIKEEDWAKQYPEKVELVNEKLPELLKQKPQLSYAIINSTNRYEEAWDQLMGHGKIEQPKPAEKKRAAEAPGSPASMPKSAGVNQAMNLMDMSDAEFNKWRSTKRRRR